MDVLLVLKKKGFISLFSLFSILNGNRVFLFKLRTGVKINLVSLPSRPVYVSWKVLSRFFRSSDSSLIIVLSTSKGVLCGASAVREGVGGVVICSARLFLSGCVA